MAYLVFTDFDGTLLNAATYDYQAAIPTVQTLTQRQIPVVPVTSKTRQEVEWLRQAMGLTGPFIVENGSAIYGSPLSLTLPDSLPQGDYQMQQLGCNYVTARAALKVLAQEIGRPLKGFGDWTVDQVAQLTGLSLEAAQRAKAREFSEPFMTPRNVTVEVLQRTAAEIGFQVVVGDRFSHLVGAEAGKGQAMDHLLRVYQEAWPGEAVTTIGLGNGPSDLPLLERVDYPIVVPGQDGPHSELAGRGWPVAEGVAPQGWAMAVEEVLGGI
ncbi:MAG: HAD-IIB family hydrolase [Leptolyngbyaceae cyanobacterium SM2_5_2]|nr:HAD-IIB family hydrolase [Leptolyngbyaceae cyanobacterium SM2_5_2]